MLQDIKKTIRSLIPEPLLSKILSAYHFALAWLAGIVYGNPSRSLLTIGVTGTKGKTTVSEMLNAILEEAGYKTCLVNSIRFKIGDASQSNVSRTSTPGRFFLQNFLDDALKNGCNAAVIELTSEGARQHRHRFLDLDALLFLNLAPEHIESHGSFEAYQAAKFELGKQLVRSHKRPRIIVANADDKSSAPYLTLPVEHSLPFSLRESAPYAADSEGGYFTFDDVRISLQLPGVFSLMNGIAAATAARALGIHTPTIAHALGGITRIAGRAERIEAGQNFIAVVDYAHTPDSLTALYDAYKNRRKICVLGASGGGRDTWKRPVMGRIAQAWCETVILTNEDPHDEDPAQIVEDIAHGMTKRPTIIMDRREAIREALSLARENDTVLITGKGTDPSIVIARGAQIPWNEARIVREELTQLLRAKAS